MENPGLQILIFLDFDGVLHSKYCTPDKYFSKLKLFEDTVRPYKNHSIVISSNWRYQYSFAEIVSFFAVDIQNRIVDCTRELSLSKASNRYEEIIDYLQQAKRVDDRWIAIDDSIHEFPQNLENVIFCHPGTGFDERIAKMLNEKLRFL